MANPVQGTFDLLILRTLAPGPPLMRPRLT